MALKGIVLSEKKPIESSQKLHASIYITFEYWNYNNEN